MVGYILVAFGGIAMGILAGEATRYIFNRRLRAEIRKYADVLKEHNELEKSLLKLRETIKQLDRTPAPIYVWQSGDMEQMFKHFKNGR